MSVVDECTRRDAYRAQLDLLPQYMQEGVVRYIEHGILPGGFLRAVICNDLLRAVSTADHVNAELLQPYCIFFANFAPPDCWGSRQKMVDWNRRRGLQGGK